MKRANAKAPSLGLRLLSFLASDRGKILDWFVVVASALYTLCLVSQGDSEGLLVAGWVFNTIISLVMAVFRPIKNLSAKIRRPVVTEELYRQ